MSRIFDFSPALIVFDKDGTLIDFNFMWASWISELARRLEHAANLAIAPQLYAAMGYDAVEHRVIPGSPLAAHSMADLRVLTCRIVLSAGLSPEAAETVTARAWFVPDPVALARPLADLPRMFSNVHARGILCGIATSDDRASTLETLHTLGIASLVNALVSADDGFANKPAPDMLLHVCRELNVAPGASAMVGDSVADMQAARAAGFGLRVGVLSGVSARSDLEPFADLVVGNLDAIL